MKSIHTLLASAFLASTSVTPVFARDTVIGLSSVQKPDVVKRQVERIILHLTKTLKPGETARFFDASSVKLIATFEAPTGKGVGNPRYMINKNRGALAKLKSFIANSKAVPGRLGLVDFSGLMHTVMRFYPAGKSGRDFIVLGSPIADAAQAPSLSMRGGRVPNDGHLQASFGQSHYGSKGVPGSLAHYDVYFGDISEPWGVSQTHEHFVERFWTLKTEAHGGSLTYFGNDLETLFGLAGKDQPEQKHAEGIVETDKLEMIQFAPDNGTVADIYTKPLAKEPAPEPIWQKASNVTIGITWDALDVDLDLFVRPKLSAPVIFYKNASTSEGRLFKDFRASPRTGFETVALNGSFDLSKLRLAVNFYNGRAAKGRVTGEIRIAIGERVWAKPFTFNRSHGNGGRGAEKAVVENLAPNDAWIILDPMAVIRPPKQ